MRQLPKTLLGPVFAIALLGSFLSAGRITAQMLPLTRYTTANGLAHDSVNRIIRDSRGFMWFGTGEGLSRFDGYEFKNYTQADGLPNRSVNDILELPDRGLFLLATSNGVVVFDPKGISERQASGNPTPMFRTFRPPQLSEAKGAAIVFCLTRTRDGHVWIGTGDGLYDTTVNGAELSFRRVDRRNWLNAPSLPAFNAVMQDRTGKFWLSVPLGTVVYDPTTDQPTLVRKQPEGGNVLFEDRSGYIWSGGGNTDDTGLARFTLRDGVADPAQTVTFTPKDGLGLNGWFNGLVETKDGRFFVGQPSGVTQYQPDAPRGQPKFRTVVSDADVLCLAEDIDGNLWIGTDTRGVMKLSRKGFEVFGQKEGLPDAQVSSVIPGTGGEIFTSSGYFELARFDGTKFSSVRPQGMRGRSWGWNQIDVHSAIDGDWWIATKTGVLRYAAPATFEQLGRTPPKRVYDLRDGFRTPEVFRMWEDSRGNVWIYPFNSLKDNITYLFRWERSTDQVRRFSSDEGVPWGTNTSAFGEDRAGNIWIGAYNGGITRYRNGQFHYYSPDTGFPAGFVNAFLLDRQGRLWVATGTSGVVRIDDPTAEELHFQSVTVANGLSSNQATCLTEDKLGRIYIGTGKGITRLEPDTGRVKIYNQADGLPFSAIRTCGADADGNVWFAQQKILARLKPETGTTTAPPPIYVGDVQVNGKTIAKLSELGETEIGELSLNPDQRQIEINFFGLGFAAGERLLYQYKLEGSGGDWSTASAQRAVSLSLSPGHYRFLVRAVNAEGLVSEHPAVVTFTIARPIWQRWWFLLLAALALAGIVYAIYRYRLRRMIELERVRTRIATDLHDDIGSSLSQIAILSEVVRQRTGENGMSEPLNVIANTSREMVDSMSDIVWAINPQKDHLSDLAHRMRRFASDLLDATEIAYRFELPGMGIDVPLGADVRRELYLVFKECLNNAVKHSGATEIVISIKVEGGQMQIGIADNGSGFDVETKLNGNHDGLGGNGLINMQRRVEKLNGTFTIRSAPGHGATVTISVPVRRTKWFQKAP